MSSIAAGPGSATFGREAELELVEAFARTPASGQALVIEGEPGIGKTTLWRAGVEAAVARGTLVLRSEPTAAEEHLSFSALGDLLGGRLDEVLDRLPDPQRRALRVAVVLDEAGELAPEPMALASAVLGVLRALAEERPVLVAIDDAQWLDAATVDALSFALRRVGDHRIALLVAQRTSAGGRARAATIATAFRTTSIVGVAPLTLDATHHLVVARYGRSLPPPAMRRMHEVSGGNPFYVLELARSLARRGWSLAPGEALPVPDTLRGLVDETLDELGERTRRLVARVAALFDPSLAVVAQVARAASLDGELDAALAAGVLELCGLDVRFSHPLLAAAAYDRIGPEERQLLHRELAASVPPGEEHALHLALAAAGADEPTAAVLEREAAAVRARGACATAAVLAEHAIRLTPDEEDEARHRRLFTGASYHVQAGDYPAAAAIYRRLASILPPGPERARALSSLAWPDLESRGLAECARLHEEALLEAAPDPATSALLSLRLSTLERILGDLEAARTHAVRAMTRAEEANDDTILAAALGTYGYVEMHLGRGVLPELRRAAELARTLPHFLAGPSPVAQLIQSLCFTDALAEAHEQVERELERAADASHETARAELLFHKAEIDYRRGDWPAAAAAAEETRLLYRQGGGEQEYAVVLRVGAIIDATRGRIEEAREAAGTGLAIAERLGDRSAAAHHRGVLGFIELSLGDPDTASSWLEPAVEHLLGQVPRELGGFLAPPLYVEALVAQGRLDEAERILEQIERSGERTGTPSVMAAAARCRGLLLGNRGDLEAARACLHTAIDAYTTAGRPFERARTYLIEGVIERRMKQKRLARGPLDRGLALFQELGAPLWADRARLEIERLGIRRSSTRLTQTEQRIARLAAEGLSNRRIAAEVFVSEKTVEANLSRVYRKLGIRGRIELDRRLGAD